MNLNQLDGPKRKMNHDMAIFFYHHKDMVNCIERLQDSRKIYESLVYSNSLNASYINDLADIYCHLASSYLLIGELSKAQEFVQECISYTERIVQNSMNYRSSRQTLALGHINRAAILLAKGELGNSLKDADKGVLLLRELIDSDPENAITQLELSRALIIQAHTIQKTFDYTKTANYLAEAINFSNKLIEIDSTNAEARMIMIIAYGELLLVNSQNSKTQTNQMYSDYVTMLRSFQSDGINISTELERLNKTIEQKYRPKSTEK